MDMGDEPPQPPPKIVPCKFSPKPQRKKHRAPVQPKTEVSENSENQQVLQQLREQDAVKKQRGKVGNKTSVQPAFIHDTKQSTATGASSVSEERSRGKSIDLKKYEDDDEELADDTFSFTDSSSEDGAEKYEGPWNYKGYYPNSYPLREPHSGNPDILNEAEFGDSARKREYDEETLNAASELGLLNPDAATDMMFFIFPPSLPAIKPSATAKGKEKEGASSTTAGTQQRGRCRLEELPAGVIGKLQVYKSGVVKLKLGDTLFDVSPGTESTVPQDVAAINVKEKDFSIVGNLDKRAVVTPDIKDILDNDPLLW